MFLLSFLGNLLIGQTPTTSKQEASLSSEAGMSEESPMEIFDIKIKQPTCPGSMDGSISFSVKGGTPPYAYQWKEFGTLIKPMNGLGDGDYHITITDLMGDQIQHTFTIMGPKPMDCKTGNKLSDPNLIYIRGGTPPYIVTGPGGTINTNSTFPTSTTLPVTIQDSHNCTFFWNPSVIYQGNFQSPFELVVEADRHQLIVIPRFHDLNPVVTKIELYSMDAKFMKKWSFVAGKEVIGFSIKDFAIGTYFVKITSGEHEWMEKIQIW